MALGHFGQEQAHHLGVHPGQHQGVHHTVVRTDGAKGVEVLALQACAHHGAYRMRRPAAPGRSQEPETSLVLEHQPHRAVPFSLAQDLAAYLRAQFF